MTKNNIILIGMPGVGKSTIGVVLAKVLGYDFLDSDLLIQKRERARLSKIIERVGPRAFLEIENEVNASIQVEETVIATGGSAVFGREAMEHLRSMGRVIYLKLPLDQLSRRLGNLAGRGVVSEKGQSLSDIYAERTPLYEKYADITIDESGKTLEESLQCILDELL